MGDTKPAGGAGDSLCACWGPRSLRTWHLASVPSRRPSLHILVPVAADPSSATQLSGTGPSCVALGLKCWLSFHVTAVRGRAPEHTSRCGGCGWGRGPQVTGRQCRSAQEPEGVGPGRDAGFPCQGQAGWAPCSSSVWLLLEDTGPSSHPAHPGAAAGMGGGHLLRSQDFGKADQVCQGHCGNSTSNHARRGGRRMENSALDKPGCICLSFLPCSSPAGGVGEDRGTRWHQDGHCLAFHTTATPLHLQKGLAEHSSRNSQQT